MADLVSEMLGKFTELAQEEKNINADIDKALKEYNDYCKSSDNDLNRKLEEIRGKIRKVSELMQYAREHARDLEEAQMPFETSEGVLESIRQTIKLDSRNDPNAESLYTKASGQKLFYEAEMERTRKLIEGSKVQAKRQYDSDVALLESRKEKHEQELRAYVLSEDFKRYLQLLSFDKSAFNSHSTVNLIDKSKISIGQRRIRFSVPMEVEQDLTTISNGEYNPASRTIGAPFRVPTQKGSVLMLEYDDRNQTYLMGGVERLLLNLIKYCGTEITDMVYLDPSANSLESLGIMSAFAKGINPFIIAPQSPIEINSKMSEIYSAIKANPTPSVVSRVIVINGFPESFGPEFSDQVMDLARNIAQSGVMLIIIHNGAESDNDIITELRSSAITIRSRNGSFYIDRTRESLFWYSKPSDIPDAVRRMYIEQRRVAGVQQTPVQPAAYTAPQPAYTAPAPVPAAPVAPAPVPAAPVAPAPAPAVDTTPAPEAQPYANAPQPEEVSEEIEKADQVNEDLEEDVETNSPEAAEEEEVTAEKGSRRLPKIILSKRGDRLDISNNAAYICGKNGEDRTKIVKAVLDRIQACTHPDSAELWLFDNDHSLFGLVASDSAHLKYAISDEADETAVDFVELLVCEKNSRVALFKEKHYADYDEIPESVYLPRIIAVISDFTELLRALDRAPKYFGKSARRSLESLIKNCAKYGINLVLVGSTFSENGKAPDVLGSSVESAAAVFGREKALGVLFDGTVPGRIPEGHVLVSGTNGAVLAKIDIPEQDEAKSFTQSYEYDGNEENYLEKNPLIADRSTAVSYSERESSRAELIAIRENSEIMLFLGEPSRISANAPIILREDYAENLLELAPKSSEKSAAATVAAALKSLEEQGISAEIITAKDNSVYTELAVSGLLSGVKVVESDGAAARIKELSSQLGSGMMNELLIILGGDVLMTSIHAEDQNASAELKKLFLKGAKNGCRVMFVCSSVSQMASGFLALFRHKVVFPCPAAEAEKLLQISDCELLNNAFRVSDDSEEFSAVPYKI
ncbi:MAG: hypothetical protein J1F03_02350 [Oscillospiraceae bacterium]|nr:hypothetical protein [Oscillospiraceae bacterium]